MTIKKIISLGIISALVLITVVFSSAIFGKNDAGFYKIKQSAIKGKMTTINKAGVFMKMFAKTTTYKISDIQYFSKSDLDGGRGEESEPINVMFNDGGTAKISGSLRYRLSLKDENQKKLHSDYRVDSAIKETLIRQVIQESLLQTASLMKPEDVYSTRRSEFTSIAEAQMKEGIFETISEELSTADAEGNMFINKVVEIKKDKDGHNIVRKVSAFKMYDIEIIQFTIKDIDFDEAIDKLISEKKSAEQRKVLAKAKAEEAKQNAITAEESGKEKVALARAEEEATAVKEVIQAEKNKQVAVLKSQQKLDVAIKTKEAAEYEAKAMLIMKEAEAKSAELLVKAGLTPREKAEYQMKTSIGVAEQLAKVAVPKIVISGGSNSNGASPMDAIGIKMLLEIEEKMSKKEIK